MMNDHVKVTENDGVLAITLNRTDKKNALTSEMYDIMGDVVVRADSADAIRVLLITGSGDSFTAGNDMTSFQQSGQAGGETRAHGFIDRFARLKKPVVAAVNGLAIGIGATMLLHCDIVYAAQAARLRFPFVDLGLVPENASSLLLPRLAGYQRAADLMLTGRFFSAAEAYEIGLVSRALPAEELLEQATAVARTLATKPVQALAATRRLLKGDLDEILARKDQESAIFNERLHSEEAQAIFAAFLAGSRR
jgi:enoyl-CoA hydratase/carnithine racemase